MMGKQGLILASLLLLSGCVHNQSSHENEASLTVRIHSASEDLGKCNATYALDKAFTTKKTSEDIAREAITACKEKFEKLRALTHEQYAPLPEEQRKISIAAQDAQLTRITEDYFIPSLKGQVDNARKVSGINLP